MGLYMSLIQPIVLYCCKILILTAQVEKKLLTFKMATLRTKLGECKLEKICNYEKRKREGHSNTLVQLVYAREHK